MRKFCLLYICFFGLVACTSEQRESNKEKTETSRPAVANKDTIQTAAPATEAKPTVTNPLIIPGKSIGLIKLNEDAEVVHKVLGEPTQSNAGTGKSLQTWVTQTPDDKTQQISMFFSRNMGNADEKSRVKQIRITAAGFASGPNAAATEKTIKDNRQEARKTAVYPLPGSKEQITIYDKIKAGIAFEFDQQGNCIAITVHEPGKAAFEIFTQVASDLKKVGSSE